MKKYPRLFQYIFTDAMDKMEIKYEKYKDGWLESTMKELEIRLKEHVDKIKNIRADSELAYSDILDIINYGFMIGFRLKKTN